MSHLDDFETSVYYVLDDGMELDELYTWLGTFAELWAEANGEEPECAWCNDQGRECNCDTAEEEDYSNPNEAAVRHAMEYVEFIETEQEQADFDDFFLGLPMCPPVPDPFSHTERRIANLEQQVATIVAILQAQIGGVSVDSGRPYGQSPPIADPYATFAGSFNPCPCGACGDEIGS